MKLFHLYVFKMFLKYIIIVQLFVTIMSVFSSTMGDSRMLSEYNYSFLQFAQLQFYAVMLNFNIVMPITTTVATLIVILLLMRSHELMAYVSIGGTILHLAVPFVTVGMLITSGMILSEYKIIPKVRDDRELAISNIKGQEFVRFSMYVNMWLMDSGNKLIKIDIVDMLGKEIRGVEEYIIDDKFQVNRVVSTELIQREGDLWKVTGKTITDISVNPPVVNHIPTELVSNKLWDDLLKISVGDVRVLSPTQLYTLSNVMKSRGLNINKYQLLFYKKFANALSVIVLLVLIFPIAIDFSRNYSIIKNATITFAMGLLFWVSQAVSYTFGETGVFSPFLANFIPLIVFICLSMIIIYRRERAR